MKRLSVLVGMAVLVLLEAPASRVRADYMNWSYTADVNAPGVTVGATNPGGGAAVSLTDFTTPQAGGASVPVQAYVTSTSSTTPISFGPSVDTPSTFNLAMTITDNTTHDSGTLNFTGSLTGSMTATTSSVVASFVPVTSNSLTLDGHTYTVNIPSVTLASPTSPQQNIMANVSVANASSGGGGVTPPTGTPSGGNPPPPNHDTGTPEPASLLLGSLGFSCFGIHCLWRRRRLTRTEATA